MGFTDVITDRPKAVGNMRMSRGTWEGDTDTSGDIDTGLRMCHFLELTTNGSAPGKQPAVTDTLPHDGSAVGIDMGANTDGYWQAWGY